MTEYNYRGNLTKVEAYLLSVLAGEDRTIFTIDDVRKIIARDARKTMHSLAQKKWVLPLKRGLYTIVPLDIGVKGADHFAVHEFVVAAHLVEPYYIGFWSALNYHGLTDQIPRTVFVATTRAKMKLNILANTFYFVKLSPHKFFGFFQEEVAGTTVLISDPAKTIADCLDHPEHAGGIEEVAQALYFSHQELDFATIKEYAERMRNSAIFKRLGWCLERTGLLDRYEFVFSGVRLGSGYSKLAPLAPPRGKHDRKWGLLINYEIDPQRWES